MWLVIKYKKKQLNLLKEEFKKKLGITPDEFCRLFGTKRSCDIFL